jgi:hypothetical protein
MSSPDAAADANQTQGMTMNTTTKFAASLVAVVALSAVMFTSSRADSMNAASSTTAPSQSTANIQPANSPETPQDQLSDLSY